MNQTNNNNSSSSSSSRSSSRSSRTYAEVVRSPSLEECWLDDDDDLSSEGSADNDPTSDWECHTLDSDDEESMDYEESTDLPLLPSKRPRSRSMKKRPKKKSQRNHVKACIPTGSDVSPLPTARRGKVVTPKTSDDENTLEKSGDEYKDYKLRKNLNDYKLEKNLNDGCE